MAFDFSAGIQETGETVHLTLPAYLDIDFSAGTQETGDQLVLDDLWSTAYSSE